MAFSDLWDNFSVSVKEGLPDLTQNTIGGFLPQAEADAVAFLEATGKKLRRWGDLLAEQQITVKEFEFLLVSQRDLATLHALTATGVALTRIERFRTGIISLILKSAFSVIGL